MSELGGITSIRIGPWTLRASDLTTGQFLMVNGSAISCMPVSGTTGPQGDPGPPGPAPSGTGFVRVSNGVLDPVVGFGTGAGTLCQGNDGRLSDARIPLSHGHNAGDITSGQFPMSRLASGTPNGSQFIRDDGALATPAGGGGPSLVKKTADQTFNSATPANVSGLSFAVSSGVYYHYRFVCLVRSTTATVGIRMTVTIPAVTCFGGRVSALIAADGVGASFDGAITTSGDAVVPTAVPAINTDYVQIVEGLILPSANGTLQLQAATETGTTIVTVRQGSCGFLTVLP